MTSIVRRRNILTPSNIYFFSYLQELEVIYLVQHDLHALDLEEVELSEVELVELAMAF